MSRPPTPPADRPTSSAEWRFHPLPCPTEWIEDYRPGKYHPVHFGDTLKDARYRIIRKLGYGSFSTVWLARDQTRDKYIALKILIADPGASKHELAILEMLSKNTAEHPGTRQVVTLEDFFEHKGPNGTHRCLIFDVMGPSVAGALENPSEALRKLSSNRKFPVWMIKSILYQTLLGISFLHDTGIGHGDLQQGNLLFSVRDLETVGEEELARDNKVSEPVKRKDGRVDLWAPRYLALNQPLDQYINIDPDFIVKLSDLGGAFFLNDPPATLVTPVALRSPELIFTNTVNKDQDIWSFGCLIFELFIGRHLFSVTNYGHPEEVDDEHLLQFHDILGPLPETLRNAYPRAQIYYNKEGEIIRNYIGELPEGFDPTTIKPAPSLEQAFDDERLDNMTGEEADVIKELIRWILDYDPAKRPTASELLQHSWFVEIGHTLRRDI
ncbi:kinase-like domain-containing protein [Aspergillus crustosus]